MGYLSIIVLLPMAAVLARSMDGGVGTFWDVVTTPEAVAALKLTVVISLIVAAINAVAGTLIAWVLVRDEFPGKKIVGALIDLPFALPTIVAGLTLLALYGPRSPLHVNIGFTRVGIAAALLFVTLPFVVRSVQPVLLALDPEVEEAAASLGARPFQVFRRVVLPSITPAVLSGAALGFARAVGEFGSIVILAGNLPFKTEVASIFIYKRIQSDDPSGAAAVSVVLLAVSLIVLLAIRFAGRRTTGDGE
ncbi:MAG: sulfate/thiosulfate transport system permease protein [Thermoleophilaceae bacterium]|jgi:sulfate transport system permease protein|nr:sulfate/thiosulfate transport system permease protein [Thermoleophilaceae bacterium]